MSCQTRMRAIASPMPSRGVGTTMATVSIAQLSQKWEGPMCGWPC